MNIRNKLTLRFILIVAIITFMASVLIYIFSADYRREDYYTRLHNKANNTATLLIEVDEVDVNLLRKLEKDNPISLPNERIIVYDFHNEVIFSTDEDKTIHVDQDLLDRIRLEEEIRYTQGDYEVLGFLFKGRYDRFAVIAAATDIYGFNKLKNLRTILLLVFAFSIIVASVSGWFFSGKALQPISKVVNRVDEISITSLNLRVDEGNGKDEIALLAKTFNDMLKRLEVSFTIQKNFIANASHELRTPLTAITGQLEVTLLNTRSTDEYIKVLNSVLEDIKSLNNLSNRLLLLAQTSTEVDERKMIDLRVDELLWQTRDELAKRNPAYNIHIDFHQTLDDDASLTMRGDEHLIKVALSNIIDNACKYSSDHTCYILIQPANTMLTLTFRDHGIGIPEEDHSNIFEPFYRAGNTQSIKGHGIGLSMVNRIVALHQGTIQLQSVVGEGTTIILSFPAV
ncbi:MAG TPA: HAMP domain-containing sensor histidine kinase [Ohtaekwangia sp.]|uniref:sensor histidine kinase n=1 Tax=Ohtaekwangia sp. TaxID=2066019 RepID=UPI002F95E1F4